MNGSETLLACDILHQNRFQYVVIVLVMVGTILAGATIGALVVKLGAPPKAQGGVTSLSFLLSIGLAAWYLSGVQGKVLMTATELVIKPNWRPAIRIQLPPVEARLQIWSTAMQGYSAKVGPILAIKGRDASVSLGSKDLAAAERLPSKEGIQILKSPSFEIAPEQFEKLIKILGVTYPDGR